MAAVGSMTQTLSVLPQQGQRKDKLKLTLAWTSHTDGTVSGISTDDGTFMGQAITKNLIGKELVYGECTPGATTPSDLYDVDILDANSVDLFSGGFDDCSNSATKAAYPFNGIAYGSRIVTGALTPSITAAGSGKTGTIVLLFE